MIEMETCPKCNGTGLVQIAPNVRGLKKCPFCNGYGGKIKTKREESNENNEDGIVPAQEEEK
jgi:DnaJ-class molecular chaperone